jgi:hypothetical protein
MVVRRIDLGFYVLSTRRYIPENGNVQELDGCKQDFIEIPHGRRDSLETQNLDRRILLKLIIAS